MRLIITTILGFGFGIYLLYSSHVAYRSGVATYRKYRYSRIATPKTFWFFIVYTGLVGLASCVMTVIVLIYGT